MLVVLGAPGEVAKSHQHLCKILPAILRGSKFPDLTETSLLRHVCGEEKISVLSGGLQTWRRRSVVAGNEIDLNALHVPHRPSIEARGLVLPQSRGTKGLPVVLRIDRRNHGCRFH